MAVRQACCQCQQFPAEPCIEEDMGLRKSTAYRRGSCMLGCRWFQTNRLLSHDVSAACWYGEPCRRNSCWKRESRTEDERRCIRRKVALHSPAGKLLRLPASRSIAMASPFPDVGPFPEGGQFRAASLASENGFMRAHGRVYADARPGEGAGFRQSLAGGRVKVRVGRAEYRHAV